MGSFAALFGKSPFGPLAQHAKRVRETVSSSLPFSMLSWLAGMTNALDGEDRFIEAPGFRSRPNRIDRAARLVRVMFVAFEAGKSTRGHAESGDDDGGGGIR
jgi:hypothetical protein